MNKIELVIFDFDGVIVDSEYLYKKANIIALAQAGISIPDEELNQKFWGLDYKSILNLLTKEFGDNNTQKFHNLIQPLAKQIFIDELEAIPNVLEYIEAMPYEFCIGSNSRTIIIKEKLDMLGLLDLFANKYYGADLVAKPKPAIDLFKHCADSFGVDYRNCLVIEDGTHGIVAARKLGMTSIGFTGASHQIDDHANLLFEAGAVAVIDDMLQLHSIVESLQLDHN